MRDNNDFINEIQAKLNSPSPLPRYKQLYEELRTQILNGLLTPGLKLPSSRQLAKRLNLSRNTTIAALNQLCAEGYAESRPASGIYILPAWPARWDKLSNLKNVQMTGITLSSRGQRLYQDAPKHRAHGAFIPGVPDLKLFPWALWQRYLSRYARNPKLNWQSYPQQGGLKELQQIIMEHLRIFRGIQCLPQQVLITHGTQNSLNLIVSLLTDAQDPVWMENPGYPGARSAFLSGDLHIIGQDVDAQGIAPALSAWKNPPRLIYVTPSHQYPLGVVMSASRRQQLLMQASGKPTWFIEDDYDSEFRFEGAPIAAMQAIAPHQVIYLGTFSKTLFPALGIGYMVLPENCIDAFRAVQARHQREPAYVLQCALANFIADGHYSAHVRTMRQEYCHRKTVLVNLLRENLGEQVQLQGTDTGLHLTLILPSHIDSEQIETQAYQQGIIARSLKKYYLPSAQAKNLFEGTVLGFGQTDSKKIVRAGKILTNIIEQNLG